MGKAELGMKLTCESCGARFYDLNKQPASCPKCGTANTRPAVFKTRGGRAAPEEREEKRAPVAVKQPEPEEADDAVPAGDEEDDDEAVIEDTSDLGEDDDVGVAVENDEPT